MSFSKSIALIVFLLFPVTVWAASGDTQVQGAPVKRVGIVNYMDKEITNLHVGFTVFGNFKKLKPDDWNMADYANKQVISKLASESIEAFVLSPPPELIEQIKKQYYWTWIGKLNAKKAEPLKKYMETENLDAIVILGSGEMEDPIGGTRVTVAGQGIYTEGKVENPEVAAIYTMYLAIAVHREPFKGARGNQCLLVDKVALRDIAGTPLEEMSLQQLEWFRPYLQSQADFMVERLLTTGGLSSKPIPECPSQDENAFQD